VNFLAHLFLSGNNPELLIGNFIADHVKGNKKFLFPAGIRKGIELHRFIDSFTDSHSITRHSKELIYPSQRKYAPVVVDLFYDHFLAANFNSFSEQSLSDFTAFVYTTLRQYHDHLPEAVQHFLPHMIERDWLTNYATLDGISRSLKGLSKRVRFENQMADAHQDLVRHYDKLEEHFNRFFPELVAFVLTRPHENLSENQTESARR
jgi:acyl carrier protein phosphodiesterase